MAGKLLQTFRGGPSGPGACCVSREWSVISQRFSPVWTASLVSAACFRDEDQDLLPPCGRQHSGHVQVGAGLLPHSHGWG